MNFAPTGQFDSVQAIKSRNKGIWVFQNMSVVILEYSAEELVFGMRDGLDDKSIISGEIEERA